MRGKNLHKVLIQGTYTRYLYKVLAFLLRLHYLYKLYWHVCSTKDFFKTLKKRTIYHCYLHISVNIISSKHQNKHQNEILRKFNLKASTYFVENIDIYHLPSHRQILINRRTKVLDHKCHGSRQSGNAMFYKGGS